VTLNEELFSRLKQKFPNLDGWKTIETALEAGENTPENLAKAFEKAGLPATVAASVGQTVHDNFKLDEWKRVLNATGFFETDENTPENFAKAFEKAGLPVDEAKTAGRIVHENFKLDDFTRIVAPTRQATVTRTTPIPSTAGNRNYYRALLYGSWLLIGIALIFTGFEVGAGSRHGGTAFWLVLIGVLLAWYCIRLIKKHLPPGDDREDM